MAKKEPKPGKVTTIKLQEETKFRIEKLRENKGESYDDILKKILYVLNAAREEPERAKKILEKIEEIKKKNAEEAKEIKEDLKAEKLRD